MTSAKILIIDDDMALNTRLAAFLREQGFLIEQEFDGDKGLNVALHHTFDLILMNVVLPAINGLSVLNMIRKVKQTPVMLMADCDSEERRIEGYTQGADDVVPTPFSLREINVRIGAILRRVQQSTTRVADRNTLVVDELVLSRTKQMAAFDDNDLSLTPVQFRLLWLLVDNKAKTLNKPFLYQSILERRYSRDDRSLDMHLSRVRKKLVQAGMCADRLITVHGEGYRFS